MKSARAKATVNSALWAAYGDVLGFPTELVDQEGVRRRLGAPISTRPQPWKRLVGGRNGVWITFDAGTYSDDTQLRLASSRSIRGDGYFDVESFAKIELPVWLSYSLGAGRASKVGAAALSQRGVNWFSNFFEQRDVIYTNGGGNGAAMRIQPHVWASKDLGQPDTYLPQVIQNAVCTHGHPRGIAGAAIHAGCLAHTLKTGYIPSPEMWSDFDFFVTLATAYIEDNPDLSTFWLPIWSSKAGSQFAEEMERVRFEWIEDVKDCLKLLDGSPELAYRDIVEKLGGLTAEQRGSGLKCALFSLVAAWLFRKKGAEPGILAVVNLLGSDTDTIATMTGALLGVAFSTEAPPSVLQDQDYLVKEALRLFDISQGVPSVSFLYPDLLTWQPPRSQSDSIGLIGDRLIIAGLGEIEDSGVLISANVGDVSWQWLKLEFGQTVLCKRRNELVEMAITSLPNDLSNVPPVQSNKVKMKPKGQGKKQVERSDELFDSTERNMQDKAIPISHKSEIRNVSSKTIDELTDDVIKAGFSSEKIGTDLLSLAELPDGIEKAIAYVAVIVKARQARLKRGRE